MRLILLLVGIVASCLILPPPAHAVREDEFAFSLEGGMVGFGGNLGDVVAADLGYGASFVYGVFDWLGVEGGAIYSAHQQDDKEKTGEVNLGHFVGMVGPRFSWNTRLVVPYVSVAGAAVFLNYKAKWHVGDDTLEDTNDAHGYGGIGTVGLDFYVHDAFTIGIAGRGGWLRTNLEYTNGDARSENAGGYPFLAGTLRLTLLF